MNHPSFVRVAAAVITRNGYFLITRRKRDAPLAGLWEFPGGKCEDGEPLERCLYREVLEELGVEIAEPKFLVDVYYEYPDSPPIHLSFFRCSIHRGTPRPLECMAFRWVKPEEFPKFDFPPADEGFLARLLQGVEGI